MSIQPIRLFGDPVLTTPATPVESFDKELRTLVKDLMETMHDAPGAGLAAPQIGVPLRVFVWDVDDVEGHLVNPSLSLSDELQYDTPRALRVVARGFNMHGEPIVIEGTEYLSRAIQHETDHLDGILFIDRMPTDARKLAMKEIRESEWFGSAIAHGRVPVIKSSPHATRGLGI
jgi:peptide deformylase